MQSINFNGRLRDVYQALFASLAMNWYFAYDVCRTWCVYCSDTAIQSVLNYTESIVIKSKSQHTRLGFYQDDDVPFLTVAGENESKFQE